MRAIIVVIAFAPGQKNEAIAAILGLGFRIAKASFGPCYVESSGKPETSDDGLALRS